MNKDKKYRQTLKYKLTQKRYAQSSKGKKNHAVAQRGQRQRRRKEALQALGGECVNCHIDDVRCLQFDHINGDGYKDVSYKVPLTKYIWIRDNSEEAKKKYQILCANCNWKKRYDNNEVGRKYD